MTNDTQEGVAKRAPLSDWELWACAQQVLKQHGAGAPMFVAERLGELAVAGDAAGVATWQAIAARIDQLHDFAGARPKSRH